MFVTALAGCIGFQRFEEETSDAPTALSHGADSWTCTTVDAGTTDRFPIGAAVLTAKATDEAFVAWDVLDKRSGVPSNQAILAAYTCSDDDACAIPEPIDGPVEIGEPIGWGNSVQPALATSGGSDRDVRVLLRQKVNPDCDEDGVTGNGGDPDDRSTMDLLAFPYDTAVGVGEPMEVAVNRGATCVDRGVTVAASGAGWAHACFTERAFGVYDRVACASEYDFTWSSVHGPTNHDVGDEDHPAMVIASGRRTVAAHKLNIGAPDAVRVHLLDRYPAPDEPVVEFPSAGAEDGLEDVAKYPGLGAGHGNLSLVYQDGAESNAGIWYAECDLESGCTRESDWSVPEVVADEASGFANRAAQSQIAIDGDRQWVAYVYDSDPTFAVASRVVAATRCRGEEWTLAEVSVPDVASHDQSLEFGRPSLVVDEASRVAHLVFVEHDDYVHRRDLRDRTHEGKLRWCTRAYDTCATDTTSP